MIGLAASSIFYCSRWSKFKLEEGAYFNRKSEEFAATFDPAAVLFKPTCEQQMKKLNSLPSMAERIITYHSLHTTVGGFGPAFFDVLHSMYLK